MHDVYACGLFTQYYYQKSHDCISLERPRGQNSGYFISQSVIESDKRTDNFQSDRSVLATSPAIAKPLHPKNKQTMQQLILNLYYLRASSSVRESYRAGFLVCNGLYTSSSVRESYSAGFLLCNGLYTQLLLALSSPLPFFQFPLMRFVLPE